MKGLALLSGGLDSRLAIALVKEQGIEVEAVHFTSIFWTHLLKEAKQGARELGVKLHVRDCSEEFLEVVRKPKFGYGSGMNPCTDCRIFMLRKASDFMKEIGASFLITGEVVGQRPMSQRSKQLLLIEREAGVSGLVLRPLTAKNLPPSIPEREGWVDRGGLLGIRGRGRKEQMKLAEERGLTYPSPAGGCLLADPIFAKRMRELLDHDPNAGLNDVELLRWGRHFRLSPESKLVVGRNERENAKIQALALPEDWLIKAVERPGALSLLRTRGEATDEILEKAARITAFYTDGAKERPVAFALRRGGETKTIIASSLSAEEIEALRI